MDLFTREDLEALAHSGGEDAHVSLFIPTHRRGSEVLGDPIRWRNLLKATEAVLAERGMRQPEVAALLEPAWALHADDLAWQHMSDGLAVFLRPGWQRAFRVPVPFPDVAVVGDRFVVGPLLRILTGDEHFLLLAVSRRRVRLLEGSRQRVEEVDLEEVPTSLGDIVEPPLARSGTMARPFSSAGRRGSAVFYGHGAAEERFRQEELERFLRQVADGIRDVLATSNLPMVLVGLEEILATYRTVNEYPHVLDDEVRRNPDDLSAEQLHELAWPIVAAHLEAAARGAFARFEALHGTGRASSNPAEIAEAAAHGRIETLFMPTEPSCWQRLATGTPSVVQLDTDPAFAHCELLDRSAVQTLATNGRVYALRERLAGGSDVAAIFRY